MKRVAGLAFILFIFSVICSVSEAREAVKLATTTSTHETGVLEYILKPFEEEHGVDVHIIAVGTGKALKLGENGDVDIVLVHARSAEDTFIGAGYGVNRRDVMRNNFVILGPVDNPAGIDNLESAAEAFKRIYESKATFISRGDDSGTHKKENYLWKRAGLAPSRSWYLETGQGMSATLTVADEKGAYILIDSATHIFHKDRIRLSCLNKGDPDLSNPYGVIAVNPDRYYHVKYKLAMALIDWFTSARCQDMINDYRIGGEQIFFANAGD